MTNLLKAAGIAAIAMSIAMSAAYADGIIPGNVPAGGGIIPGNVTPPSGGITGGVQGPSGGITGGIQGPSGGITGGIQGPSGGIIPGPTLYSADYSKKGVAGAVPQSKTGGPGAAGDDGHIVALSCVVDDGLTRLMVKNVGKQAIAAGTKMKWSVSEIGAKGYLKLNADLGAGGMFAIPATFSGLAAGNRCAIDIA